MPQSSQRQVLLRVIDDALPRVRKNWRSLIIYTTYQTLLSQLLFTDDPNTSDDFDNLAIAPVHFAIAARISLIRSLENLYFQTLNHRYLQDRHRWRGLDEDRPVVIERLLNQNDDWFERFARVNRQSFRFIERRIENHPVFTNRSRNEQLPVAWQLLVGLCRLGHDGNGVAVRMVACVFSISEGTVMNCTRRVIVALVALQQEYIQWPDDLRRDRIKTRIGGSTAFGHCIGLVDGSLMPLAIHPAVRDDYVYFSRKGCSVNSLFVTDDQCRINFMSVGWGGSVHDARVYKSTDLRHRPHLYFAPEQYLQGDSGYQGADPEYIVPAYRSNVATDIPWDERSRFNKEVSTIRVKVEHTFGRMKVRWQSLRGLRSLIMLDWGNGFEQMVYWIRACAVLHNMLLDVPQDDYWHRRDMPELQERWEAEAEAVRREEEEDDVEPGRNARGQRREPGQGRLIADTGQRKRLREHFSRTD